MRIGAGLDSGKPFISTLSPFGVPRSVSDISASDKELVAAVRNGDRAAANELAVRHLRGARAVALAVTGNVEASDDICQDSFVYAIGRIDQCRDGARFGAWLRQIVRSHAKNHLRRERVRRTEPLFESTAEAKGENPLESAERADSAAFLLRALASLSEERREVILLHDLEGWTHVDIAGRMGLPPGTVRSHLHFARRALRERLRDLERGESDG